MSSDGDELGLTMVRCSTLLLSWRGQHLLTDPWFAMHLRGLPCFRRPGLAASALPPLDGVLVSHLHPDHYDPRAMARCCRPPRAWLFPPGSGRALGGLPPGGRELAPWSCATLGGVEILAVPGPHTGPKPDEVNYLITLPGWGSVFFGGDARLDRGVLGRIRGEHGPVRLALLPVGGTRIFGVRTVMCPPEAFEAAQILDARQVVPIHEGGIWLSVPPASLHRGRAAHLGRIMADAGQAHRFLHLRPGDSVLL
jgi:L-ascorbate metabolism protein UlaG (beta-lactamase superfamily)